MRWYPLPAAKLPADLCLRSVVIVGAGGDASFPDKVFSSRAARPLGSRRVDRTDAD
ncbi:hypothetical protein MMF83_00028400 [Klebsiella pneumoniae]